MADQAFTVSQLNRLSRQLLEEHFTAIRVVGELSGLARPRSGHWYFTLKDEQAQIRCAMFKNRNRSVNFDPQDGQQLQVSGRVSLYEGRGDYQLIADAVEPAGEGLLAIEFEKLKQALRAAGLFDPADKKPLPAQVRSLAIISSPTGAAIRDVLSVIGRRWPLLNVSLLPVPVQGTEASAAIAAALDNANRWHAEGVHEFDAVLMTRGGGSLEDLWAFNERTVAEAVHRSALPVISAVGHETDTVISDWVADCRAPTPSAAAELLTPDRDAVLASIRTQQAQLRQILESGLKQRRQQVQLTRRRLRHPGQVLAFQAQRLQQTRRDLQRGLLARQQQAQIATDYVLERLQRNDPRDAIPALQTRVLTADRQLQRLQKQSLLTHARQLAHLKQRLGTLNPENTLARGYAIVRDGSGNILRNTANTRPGDTIEATLAAGRLRADVQEVMSTANGGET